MIDLATHRSEGSRVYTGRARGRNVRVAARVDAMDKEPAPVIVRVPSDTLSVNSSFFLGMFGDSIRALGEHGFRRKYIFEGKDINRVIEFCIPQALRERSALSPAAA